MSNEAKILPKNEIRKADKCEGCGNPVGNAPQLLNQDIKLCSRCQAAQMEMCK